MAVDQRYSRLRAVDEIVDEVTCLFEQLRSGYRVLDRALSEREVAARRESVLPALDENGENIVVVVDHRPEISQIGVRGSGHRVYASFADDRDSEQAGLRHVELKRREALVVVRLRLTPAHTG